MAILTQHDTQSQLQSTQPSSQEPEVGEFVYQSEIIWSAERPGTLVVCCSDGRLQMSIDDFLHEHLGVFYYDRLYAPGGPGALSEVGARFMRTDHYRNDLQFLLEAHSFSQVILIFHGAAEDGPADSVCAHYRTMMPGKSRDEILQRQHDDMADVVEYLNELRPNMDIQAYLAEATSEQHIRFIRI
jgi:hypothetical protein